MMRSEEDNDEGSNLHFTFDSVILNSLYLYAAGIGHTIMNRSVADREDSSSSGDDR